MTPSRLALVRKIAFILGAAVTLGSIAYVAHQISDFYALATLKQQFERHFLGLIVLSCVYSGNFLLIACAWHCLLMGCSPKNKLTALDDVGAYALTQINKYLPTNVLHMVGRYALLRRMAVSITALTWATFAELAILLAVAGALTTIKARQLFDVHGRFPNQLWLIAVLLFFAAVSALFVFWERAKSIITSIEWSRLGGAICCAIALYLVFFGVAGLIFQNILGWVSASAPPSYLLTLSAVAGAWVAGFLLPGSPAGIGVREAALILMFAPRVGADHAAFSAIAYRMVTTVGDALVFLFGVVWARRRLVFLWSS